MNGTFVVEGRDTQQIGAVAEHARQSSRAAGQEAPAFFSHGLQAAVANTIFFLLLTTISVRATVQKDFFQNSNLNDGNNYNPAGLPDGLSSDVLLTTPSTQLNGSLSASSLNQLNSTTYVLSNGLISLAPHNGNVIGANANDAIYLGGSNSSMTIQGGLQAAGNLDVAQVGATLNISSGIDTGNPGSMTKTGLGILNLSGLYGAFDGGLAINGGTTNFLPGFATNTPLRTALSVNNLNTGPGNTVVLNVQTSIAFRGLNGVVAAPSTGINTATINLVGTSTELRLEGTVVPGGAYAGIIEGSGRVSINLGGSPTAAQTFSGNNSYTGTTTVNGGTLRIDGTTAGQGNYIVVTTPSLNTTARLTGSGSIGLATNGTIAIGGGLAATRLSAGGDMATGTLHVVTSGTGGVIFGSRSVFVADIGPAGASDLLAIAGGYIDLTGSFDTLSLSSLSGGFDGSTYTIASFSQNLGGTFNTVTGLPGNYMVSYTPTAIMLVAVPEPAAWALTAQSFAVFGWWRIRSSKRAKTA